MKNCISEGTLQAWFDGELAADEAANVAAHLNVCLRCDEAARTVDAESRIVSESLATEFAAAIPSERLRQRIDTAVAALPPKPMQTVFQSRWSGAREFFSSFRPLVYASIAATILIAGFVGFVYFKKERPAVSTVEHGAPRGLPAIPNQASGQSTTSIGPVVPVIGKVHPSNVRRRSPVYEADAMSLSWQERQYNDAITKLNEAIKIQPPLQPSLRVNYEYNLAVADNAIAAGRVAARKNPNDPQATEFMLAAYQSKIDLMNQIATARDPDE